MGKLYLYLYHEISYHNNILRVYSVQMFYMQLTLLFKMYLSVSCDTCVLKNELHACTVTLI